MSTKKALIFIFLNIVILFMFYTNRNPQNNVFILFCFYGDYSNKHC